MRQKLNLTLPEGMIEEMKIQAVREKRAVSEIVEELCRQYLGRQKKAKRKTKQAV
jgi:metal-responsive CopG/Arc/MetJ family transcriptional regulator